MHLTTEQQLQEIQENGYDLDFSTVFTHAIENYKKIAIYAGLILLVFTIIGVFIAAGVFVAIYGAAAVSENFIEEFAKIKLTGIALVASLALQVFIAALFTPLTAGFYKMTDCAEKNDTFNVSTMFYYYKARYFGPIFIAALLITSCSLVISTLLQQLGIEIAGILTNFIISFFTYFTIPLIIFGDLKPVEALKGSYVVITKQPIVILGLIVTGFLASMLGFIGCCIGLFFTIPFNYSLTYVLYHAIIRTNSIDPIDTIGSQNEN